jgi:hypothetical protein
MSPQTKATRTATRGGKSASSSRSRRSLFRRVTSPFERVFESPTASRLRADHVGTECVLGGVGGGHHRDEAAAVHHGDAIGEREHFVQLRGDQEDRLARVARGEELGVDELDGADVHAAGGLRGEQDVEVAPHLARDDDLLLIAARQRARREERIGGADVEGPDLLPRVIHDGAAVERTLA